MLAGRAALKNRLAIMVAAVPLMYSNIARGDTSPGGGVFLGYSFTNNTFDWGLEAYYLERDPCNCHQDLAYGPVVRLSFRDSAPYLSLTGMLGTDLSGGPDSSSVGFELGVSVPLTRTMKFDVLTGAYIENQGFTAFTRQSWNALHIPVGVGVRSPTTNSFLFSEQATDGRPFRDATGLPQPAWSPAGESASTLGSHWQSRAHEECASIPAFLQLAEELLELGAPNDLVQRALDAASDEMRHTRMATNLAHMYGSHHTAPTPPVYKCRPSLNRSEQLTRLAQESWLDGCLGEGAAAAIAGAEACFADNETLRTTQEIIQGDEQRHASLAQDILRWTISQDSSIAALVRMEKTRELTMDSVILSKDDVRSVLRQSHANARTFLRMV